MDGLFLHINWRGERGREVNVIMSESEATSAPPLTPTQRVHRMASEKAVVVFSMSSCCMCQVVKTLFYSLGVNPTVYELDHHPDGKKIEKVLRKLLGAVSVPAVFVGGKLVGGLDRVMASHINGSLVPLLKDAGALWL